MSNLYDDLSDKGFSFEHLDSNYLKLIENLQLALDYIGQLSDQVKNLKEENLQKDKEILLLREKLEKNGQEGEKS